MGWNYILRDMGGIQMSFSDFVDNIMDWFINIVLLFSLVVLVICIVEIILLLI